MPTKSKAAAVETPDETFEDPTQADEEFEALMNPSLDDEEDESAEAGEPDEDGEDEGAEGEADRLTGQELVDFVAAEKAKGRTIIQMAYDAGYRTVTKDGSERTLKAQFNQAYLEAMGFATGGTASSSGTPRTPAGMTRARTGAQNIIQVSQVAARAIGAVPGSVFAVEFPTGDFKGVGAQILLTLTDEVAPISPRRRGGQEQVEEPGTPLLN